MFKFFYSLLFIVLFTTSGIDAQNHAILTPGDRLIPIKGKTVEAALTGAKFNFNHRKVRNIILKGNSLENSKGTIDTLSIKRMSGANFNVNFGMFDQDIMVQWYVAPADLTIKAVAFLPTDVTGADNGVAVSIVGTNLTASDLVDFGAPANWGYWTGDDPDWNNAAPFPWLVSGTPVWVPGTEGAQPLWTTDLWSDFGDGYVVTPDTTGGAYNWIVLNDALGFEPEPISRGEVFGIVIKNNGVNPAQPDESRIGLLAAGDMQTHPGFKYYAKGRLSTTDQGWWSRKYTWDVVAAVDFPNPPIQIFDVTILQNTISTELRTVSATITDGNPGGGNPGIASVVIRYSTDERTTWNDVPMIADGDIYSGEIPGQAPGTTVDYKVVATDVNGNTFEAGPWEYEIFQPQNETLLVFNGYDKPTGYPQSYYFGHDDFVNYTPYPFAKDVWSYGPLTAELVNYYNNIIEITTLGPIAINSDIIADWLAADPDHNYMLAGDEWLGTQSNWTNGAHGPGDFIFDVLGVNYEYNDINYAASGDQLKASIVMPVEGALLGGPLFTKFTEISDTTAGEDTMYYNPYYEIGVPNWLDGVDFENDVEVDMKAIGIDGNDYYIGGHRILAAGNKIMFLSYDPISLDASPYYWYGFSASAPQVQAALWFGVQTDVQPIGNGIPKSFELSQNYPNPFNPTTTIKYSIPAVIARSGATRQSHETYASVQIKVYDLLGREVATLVNQKQAPGNYSVKFDATKLSSGVYFYRLQAGDFVSIKKMILLR
jgi:hypothetical protein